MCRKEEIAPDGVERLLRGLKAYALAVAWKARGALARVALIGNADVHQADGLFRRSSAGAGDASDADAERCAGTFANAFGESEGCFGTDGAFGVDYVCGHAD